jgi:hypothetical protein
MAYGFVEQSEDSRGVLLGWFGVCKENGFLQASPRWQQETIARPDSLSYFA